MNGAAIDGYSLDVRISERPVTANKPRAAPRAAGVPQRSPRRVMPGPRDGDDDRRDTFTPRPQPRKQPSFQVERRSLPRRSG